MIQFPETALTEWQVVAEAAEADDKLRQRIQRETEVERETHRLRVRHEANTLFQRELAAADTPALVMGTIDMFAQQGRATPVDLIEGVMKADGTCTVLGPSGVGKTTLGLQMLHSLQTGDLWLGQPVKQIAGSVGILSYDQNSALMTNWIIASGMDTSKVSMVDAHGRGNPLAVPAMRAQIAAAWRAMNVEVILVDSFSASFTGDQNDTGLTMDYYRDMQRFVLTEVGAKTTIMILHSTHAAPLKPRGSSAHVDATDTIVAVTLTDSNDKHSQRRVTVEKYREALGQEMMSPVIITAPDNVTHLVDVDLGAMSLAGMQLPAGSAAMFTKLPDAAEAPDTDSEEDEEDEDL